MRIHGDLVRLKSEVLNDQTVRALLREITPPDLWERYEATGDLDFATEIEGPRPVSLQPVRTEEWGGSRFPLIPSDILTADQLGLPTSIRELARLHKGLVLVTGPTGSGKSQRWLPSLTSPTKRATTTSSPSKILWSLCIVAKSPSSITERSLAYRVFLERVASCLA